MITYTELRGNTAVWPGVLDTALLTAEQVQAGLYLADMAKRGKWRKVRRELDRGDHLVDVKQWRPGGRTWLTALHQAAWNGAGPEVVSGLLQRGALRTQTDARGRTAHDIAVEHGRGELLELLTPPPASLGTGEIAALNANLAAIIDDLIQQLFTGEDLRALFRYPPIDVLHEVVGHGLWLPVPNLGGGFRVSLADDHVNLLGAYRELSPAGRVRVGTAGYAITTDRVTQVYENYE